MVQRLKMTYPKRTMMRFFEGQHGFYCGVDLHTRKMYLCLLDRERNNRLHRNIQAKPDGFLRAIQPIREDRVVGVESTFNWYRLAIDWASRPLTASSS